MTAARPLAPSGLPERLVPLFEQLYPHFSAVEIGRRRAAIEQAMAAAGVDHLVIYGANRVGGAVQWLTQWPVTAEAVGVVSPGRRDALFVQYHNHVRLARILAAEADVAWGGQSGLQSAIDELAQRGARRDRVGVLGPLGYRAHAQLAEAYGRVADLGGAYTRLRQLKSAEELDWLRVGAHLSDRGVAALAQELEPGLTERELGAIVERAYLPWGGTNHIHFFGVTPMAEPHCAVPAQFPSSRRLEAGDVVFTEVSASFWDYPGQVLRSFTVAADPTPLYRDLHAAAEAAFDAVAAVLRAGATPQQVVAAAGVIEDAGFTTDDDLVHGFGGGYLPPIIGSRSRPASPLPDMVFEAGMTVVVQPNVVTRDGRAGVQVGEMVLVTDTGIERLHKAPRGFRRV
jgi:Xaa-Pro aminopeptidase